MTQYTTRQKNTYTIHVLQGSRRCPFLVSLFSLLVSRFSFLVSRFSFFVFRFSFLVSRFSFLVSRFSFLDPRCSSLVFTLSLLVVRVLTLDARGWFLEYGFSCPVRRIYIHTHGHADFCTRPRNGCASHCHAVAAQYKHWQLAGAGAGQLQTHLKQTHHPKSYPSP